MRRLLVAGAVLVATAGLVPAVAAADADPPSDVLLVQDAYYPYTPPTSRRAEAELDALIAAAKKGRFPIRVALVASRSDLGAVPDLFARPQRYAAFLEQEITTYSRRPLLAVMPGGYGVAGLPASAAGALHGLGKPGATGDDLAGAAVLAIPKLATAIGHRLPAAVAGTGGRRRHSSSVLPFLLPAAVLVALGLVTAVRGRRRQRD